MKELVKTIRTKAGMSQRQFARELGTTQLSITRWESGTSIPNKMPQAQLFEFCKSHAIDLFDYIVTKFAYSQPSDDLIVYHGSKGGLLGEEIAPISRDRCDFGRGFYLGTNVVQPLTLICDGKNPKFYTLKLDLRDLKILNVDIGVEWAMLIAYHRGHMKEFKGTPIYEKYANMTKDYDVIHGFIADDRMYEVMNRFFNKEITDVALINSLSALDLGEQYACISQKACDHLEIISEKELSSLELSIIREVSLARREEGIAKTEEVLVKYRREGKFFDEIMRGES